MIPTIAESTEKLADLVAKVNTFVNAPAGTVVQTTGGPVKSIAGVIAQLENIGYIAQVRDFNTVGEMYAHESELAIGQLARVNLDLVPANNGIYRLESLVGLVKINYADLYDLNDKLPNPWNNFEIPFTETETLSPYNIIEASFAVSNGFIKSGTLEGRIEYTSDFSGASFTYAAPFVLTVAGKGSASYDSAYQPTASVTLMGAVPGVLPGLSAVHAVVASQHVFTIRLIPARVVSAGQVLSGNGRILIKDVDLDVFRKLV